MRLFHPDCVGVRNDKTKNMNLNELTIKKANEGLQNKDFSSVELTKACLDQIKKTDDKN